MHFSCGLPAAWAQTQHAGEAGTATAATQGGVAVPPPDPSQAPPAAPSGQAAAALEEAPPRRSTEHAAGPYEAPARPPLPDDADSMELRGRVEARWAALIAGDFGKAYTFETPEYRAGFSADQFRAGFGPNVKWHLATVQGLVYDRGVNATVQLLMDYSFFTPWGDEPMRANAVLRESWVKVDGAWWHKPLQLKLGMPPSGFPSVQH